jgi:hypothetical protein
MHVLEGDTVVSYVHNAAAEGMGKIGVLVALKGPATRRRPIGKQFAMHIAATNPLSLSEATLDPVVLERELAVQTAKALEENAASAKPKPEAVIHNNIIPGRMKKFLAENTLLGQAFVINPDLTVEAAAKEAGVEITGYARVAVGEGIEKKSEDFAAEVAAGRNRREADRPPRCDTHLAVELDHAQLGRRQVIRVFPDPPPRAGALVLRRPTHHWRGHVEAIAEEPLGVGTRMIGEYQVVVRTTKGGSRAIAGEAVEQAVEAMASHLLAEGVPHRLDGPRPSDLFKRLEYLDHGLLRRWQTHNGR